RPRRRGHEPPAPRNARAEHLSRAPFARRARGPLRRRRSMATGSPGPPRPDRGRDAKAESLRRAQIDDQLETSSAAPPANHRAETHQLRDEVEKPGVLSVRPPGFDGDVLALDIAELADLA